MTDFNAMAQPDAELPHSEAQLGRDIFNVVDAYIAREGNTRQSLLDAIEAVALAAGVLIGVNAVSEEAKIHLLAIAGRELIRGAQGDQNHDN